MEEIAISKFKATCLAVLERVRKTRRPILITRFGEPVAEVVPPSAPPLPRPWLGAMRGTILLSSTLRSLTGTPSSPKAGMSTVQSGAGHLSRYAVTIQLTREQL